MSRVAIGIHVDENSTRTVAIDVSNGRIVENHRGPVFAMGAAITGSAKAPAGCSVVLPASYAAVPGAGVAAPSTMVLWFRGGEMQPVLNSRVRAEIPGVTSADDLILPGYIGYEPPPIRVGDPEPTALELRETIESIESRGVPVRRFVIASDPQDAPPSVFLQMLADVLGARIKIAAAEYPAAVGAAILASLKAGYDIAGHASMSRLIHAIASQREDLVYRPDLVARRKYAR